MTELTNTPLSAWESFYVIIGSSGAVLIGLQFVVITLVAGMRQRTTIDTVNAFGTPTVVHLAMALVVSAVLSAPWHTTAGPAILLLLAGLGGLTYEAIVIRRARRQTLYQPVREDWVWYMTLPSVAYGALTLAALLLRAAPRDALFVIGGAALALLLIGIRNAWDTVLHMVMTSTGDDVPRAE